MARPKGTILSDIAQRAIKPADYLLIQQVCQTITANPKVNQKWGLYFRVRWETGVRPSEALNLKAGDIQLGSLLVRRLKKKGHPVDMVTIQPMLEMALRAYILDNKIRPSQRIFPDTIQGARFIFEKIKAKLGLPNTITLHSFRHGFALNLLANLPPGMDPLKGLTILQRALGHANIKDTAVYLRAEKQEVDNILKKMKF